MKPCPFTCSSPPLVPRRGFSLTEALVVLTVMGILIAIGAPSFRRAVEQTRADVAAANLRAVWSAQRLYWLDQRQYAGNLADLGPLLDPSLASSSQFYVYQVQAGTGSSFQATATRVNSTYWTGTFTIDETGTVTGSLQAPGEMNIVPGFQ